MFDRALEDLGIDRSAMYVTNVVKHFKFERRGKVRLHRSPDPGEQKACRVWLDGELQRVRPDIIVCLCAIAAKAILGSKFGLMRFRIAAGGVRGFRQGFGVACEGLTAVPNTSSFECKRNRAEMGRWFATAQ